MDIKSVISAARLRTLPLAMACVGMGGNVAFLRQKFDVTIFVWIILTAFLLQILSNFANDYGDFKNGADMTDRIGPERAVQSGRIAPNSMRKLIILTAILTLFSGVILLLLAFGLRSSLFYLFLGFGILALLAAYFYTAGNRPYGYVGLGDLSVFLFFGLLGVLGAGFLMTHVFYKRDMLPGGAIGFLAASVLNVNNIRDMSSDRSAGKITIPVRIGRFGAVCYQLILVSFSFFFLDIYAELEGLSAKWFRVAGFIFLVLTYRLYKMPNPDSLLKLYALMTLFTTILFFLSI